jgi:hypothetical protein
MLRLFPPQSLCTSFSFHLVPLELYKNIAFALRLYLVTPHSHCIHKPPQSSFTSSNYQTNTFTILITTTIITITTTTTNTTTTSTITIITKIIVIPSLPPPAPSLPPPSPSPLPHHHHHLQHYNPHHHQHHHTHTTPPLFSTVPMSTWKYSESSNTTVLTSQKYFQLKAPFAFLASTDLVWEGKQCMSCISSQ